MLKPPNFGLYIRRWLVGHVKDLAKSIRGFELDAVVEARGSACAPTTTAFTRSHFNSGIRWQETAHHTAQDYRI